MKRLFKALAMVLALVLTISLAQPLSAQAAAKPALTKTKRTIFVGGSSVNSTYAKGYYTLKVKDRPSKYTISWSSSNNGIAKVEKTGKYKGKVTAVTPGSAVITAEVIDTSKSPNTKYTLTCKVTVKANCAAVDISPQSVDPIEIGKTVSLNATMYNAAGNVVKKDVSVTDTVKWTSSDDSVATVNSKGVVTAVAAGTATITCYTVQTTTGTYAKIEKATAKDKIVITVKDSDKVIKSVSQKSLKTFEIEFGKDYSELLKLDNIKLSHGTTTDTLSKIEFAKNGKTAIVTAKSELAANTVYTVEATGTGTNNGVSATFTTSNGVPAAFKIFTGLSGNRVIAAEPTDIKFALYDSQGIDITPTDEKSSAYTTMAGRITCSCKEYLIPCYVTNSSVMIYEEGKRITVDGQYYDYNTRLTLKASMDVYSVSEASTVTFDGLIVTKSSKAAAELDWENQNKKLSRSDSNAGYKLVARVLKGDGTYIYSDASSTKISFEYPEPNALFGDSKGNISPFQTGADRIIIKYNGVTIGSATVIVGEERVPTSLKVIVDGQETQSVKISDAFVTNPEMKLLIYDNYGELWEASDYNNITIDCKTNNAPIISANSLGTDGLVNLYLFAYGTGSVSGISYRYDIEYVHGSTKLYNSFNVISYRPNDKAPTRYQAIVTGEKDLVVNSAFDAVNGKKVKITLVSYKGEVRYEDNTFATSRTNAQVGEYYISIYDSANRELTGYTIDEGSAVLPVVWVNGSNISKRAVGNYTFRIFRKTNGVSDTYVTGGSFVLTDTQEGATFEQTSTKTIFPITEDTYRNSSIVNMIIAQSFNFWFDGKTATAEIKDAMSYKGSLLIRTVDVTGTIRLGGTEYSITAPLTINKVIYQSN